MKKAINTPDLTDDDVMKAATDGDNLIRWESPLPSKLKEGIKRSRQVAFLKAYEQCGNVTGACKAAQINPKTRAKWIDTDPWFREHFKDAIQAYRDSIEHEIHNRAITGEQVPIVGKVQTPLGAEDQIIGYKTVKSDLLLMFQAKRHIMEYRDKYDPKSDDDKPIDATSPMTRITIRLDMIGERQDTQLNLSGRVVETTRQLPPHDEDIVSIPEEGGEV